MSYEECEHLSGHDRHQGFRRVPLGMLSDSGSDVEEVWLRAVNPPRDINSYRAFPDLPHPAEQMYQLEKVLFEG